LKPPDENIDERFAASTSEAEHSKDFRIGRVRKIRILMTFGQHPGAKHWPPFLFIENKISSEN
jgi:hypothetical protein